MHKTTLIELEEIQFMKKLVELDNHDNFAFDTSQDFNTFYCDEH